MIHIQALIILTGILGLERVEINVCKKINYLLGSDESVLVCFIFQPKMCLRVASGSSEDVDHLGIFSSEMIVIHDEFAFNLDFSIFEGQVLSV